MNSPICSVKPALSSTHHLQLCLTNRHCGMLARPATTACQGLRHTSRHPLRVEACHHHFGFWLAPSLFISLVAGPAALPAHDSILLQLACHSREWDGQKQPGFMACHSSAPWPCTLIQILQNLKACSVTALRLLQPYLPLQDLDPYYLMVHLEAFQCRVPGAA